MNKRNTTIFSAIALGISISLLGACGGSDTAATDTSAAVPATDVSLADVCPATIVIQTDWFPESEHGGLYQLMGDDAVASKDTGAVVGSLMVNGQPTGVNLEIRAGGPFLESPVVTEMYQDNAITFGYVGTDVAITRYTDAPTLAVFNALNINPQVLLWDATKHPEAKTIADAAQTIKSFYVYGDPAWMRYFEAQGLIQKIKLIQTTKATCCSLQKMLHTKVSQHLSRTNMRILKVVQSRLATNSFMRQAGTHTHKTWPFEKIVSKSFALASKKIIPIFQQAQLDYIADPTRANAIILTTVATYDSWWTQSEGDVANGAASQKDMGIVGNGETPTFGDLEEARVNDFIAKATPILREQGLEIADIAAGDITDNTFLDPSITFQG